MQSRASTSAPVVPSLVAALAGTALGVPPLPFPATFELSTLDGDNGFVLNGIDGGDKCSQSVSSAGDVNGDGIDDLIIAAPYGDPNAKANAGETYVVFGTGAGFAASIELSTLNGTNGFVINGIDPDDRSGAGGFGPPAVAAAGDVNGDGVGDLIIGAWRADPAGKSSAGESYVVFGKDTAVDGPFAASLNLSALNGANGFVIIGIDAGDWSGGCVSAAGDVNGDGIDDLIIGAQEADPNGQAGAGESYVVFGKDTGFAASLNFSALDGTNGFVINGVAAGDGSGNAVSGAGDVNGDGIDDVIIGAPSVAPNAMNFAGASYVVFGKDTAVDGPFAASLNLSTLDGTNGFVVNGINAYDYSGFAVASAGDINGDGIGDLIMGAFKASPAGTYNSGETHVVFGGAGLGAGGSLELASLNGTNGFALKGINDAEYTGASVASAGDVNGDGIGDLIIGSRPLPGSSAIGTNGRVYVVYGKDTAVDGPFAASVQFSALDGDNGFVLHGIDSNDFAGTIVASAGDVNGDGNGDLVISAYGGDPGGRSGAGETYVIFGRAPVPTTCTGDLTGDGVTNSADFNVLASNFGATVTPFTNGDLTGDGIVNSADFNILAGDFGCGT